MLDKLLHSHDFLLKEVVPQHEPVHRGVEPDCVVGFALEFVFSPEYLDQLLGNVRVFMEVVLVDMLTDFEVELDVLYVCKLLFVVNHLTTDKTMLPKFLFDPILGVDQGINSLTNFRVGIVVMEFSLNPFFGELPCKLNRGHV